MSYIIQLFAELLKGVMLSVGLFAGIAFIVVKLISIYEKRKNQNQYEAANLLEPFKKYLQKAHVEEWFEQIGEVESIIGDLEQGIVPPLIEFYKIKTEPEIYMESKSEGKTVIKIGKKYDIVSRIMNSKNNIE